MPNEHAADPRAQPSIEEQPRRSLLRRLGPGLLAGAADDDPTGIGTCTQAGAALGYSLLWTMWVTLPLVAVIQEICARIGRITGHGIAGNLRRHYSPWIVFPLVLLLVVANTVTIGADIGAVGGATRLMIGGPVMLYAPLFAAAIVLTQLFGSYKKIETILKLLTLTLLSYILTTIPAHVQWKQVLGATMIPRFGHGTAYWSTFVAILGTTISPYLFFWQASLETEEIRNHPQEEPLKDAPQQAADQFRRIRFDTWIGIGLSNLVSFFIIAAAAATLHAHGITNVDTLDQAAKALQPIAGRGAAILFSIGIIGTGLLAVPALSGSAAYAVGEIFHWPTGMDRQPSRAKGFYLVLTVATFIGLTINIPAVQHATHLSPVKTLFWASVINGVVAAPIMVMVMLMTRSRKVLGELGQMPMALQIIGWMATAVMAISAVMTFAS